MSFDRRWLDEVGSEDCQGHALWALGLCVAQAGHGSFQMLAAQLFEQALPVAAEFTSPRAWAFTLIGIDEYLRRLSGDRRVTQFRDLLTAKLMQRYADAAAEGMALVRGHRFLRQRQAAARHDSQRTQYEQLRHAGTWPEDIALARSKFRLRPAGSFRPIGSNGFYPRGKERALCDQQPIEAQATVSACIEAYQATNDAFWVAEARRAFEWFLGRNDLGLALYDSTTGGCRDGLHVDRLSQNQGAESTLAFLLSLAEMQALQNTLTSFKEPSGEISTVRKSRGRKNYDQAQHTGHPRKTHWTYSRSRSLARVDAPVPSDHRRHRAENRGTGHGFVRSGSGASCSAA